MNCPLFPLSPAIGADPPQTIRVATFNVSLYGKSAGEVASRLKTGQDDQATRLAGVIASVRPDVMLLCEVDYDPDSQTLDAFIDGYVEHQPDKENQLTLSYPYRWSIPSNTGLNAGIDLDGDGNVNLPADAHGYGVYPGQYAMAVVSRFPIERKQIRTFQNFRWSQMPGALRPVDPETKTPYHSDEVWESLRLSSKNHVDVPVLIPTSDGTTSLHLLGSHPTPPVFDGPEDRNGRRNHDEIRFWTEYISARDEASGAVDWLLDDSGTPGRLDAQLKNERHPFVILGDLNSDPKRGDSLRSGIDTLLRHPRVRDVRPTSSQHGIATARFGSGDVRVDYVLPSKDWDVVDSGVVWPSSSTQLGREIMATDHRMVWVELRVPISGGTN